MSEGREPEPLRENLLLQVQHWDGEPIERECLRPPAQPQGTVTYGYLGDLQLHLVFDEPGLASATAVRPEQLEQLALTPQKAVALGAANARRTNGEPLLSDLGSGVYSLRGAHLEYNASYLLDRSFWRTQLQKFPQGLLAAIPRKGALVFCAAGTPAVEAELARQAGRIKASAGSAAVSSWIYRFDAGGWHRHAQLAAPAPLKSPTRDHDDEEERSRPAPVVHGLGGEEDLEKAAGGQRMLVHAILAGFVLNGMSRAGTVQPWLVFALFMAVGVYSLLGVVRLAAGLGKSRGATILCMVLSFVPLVSVFTWIVLSVQATRALRASGWQVGLFGAKS